jgi:hypothetical protein
MARPISRWKWVFVPLLCAFAVVNGIIIGAGSQIAVGVFLIVLSFFGPWIRRRLVHPGTDFVDPSVPDDAGDAGGDAS